MTRAEQQRFDRLKLENEQFRKIIDFNGGVYQRQLYELVDLRVQLDLVRLAINGSEE
jgi:hypothetical protein